MVFSNIMDLLLKYDIISCSLSSQLCSTNLKKILSEKPQGKVTTSKVYVKVIVGMTLGIKNNTSSKYNVKSIISDIITDHQATQSV